MIGLRGAGGGGGGGGRRLFGGGGGLPLFYGMGVEFCRNATGNGIVSMVSLQGFRIGYILFYVNHVRATMMER